MNLYFSSALACYRTVTFHKLVYITSSWCFSVMKVLHCLWNSDIWVMKLLIQNMNPFLHNTVFLNQIQDEDRVIWVIFWPFYVLKLPRIYLFCLIIFTSTLLIDLNNKSFVQNRVFFLFRKSYWNSLWPNKYSLTFFLFEMGLLLSLPLFFQKYTNMLLIYLLNVARLLIQTSMCR